MLWEQLEYGFVLGAVYALIAVGYSLLYGVMRIVNFAHGDILTLGAYVLFYAKMHLSTPLSAIVSLLLCGVFCLCMELFIYRPLRKSEESHTVVSAICLSLFLENFLSLLFSSNPKIFDPLLSSVFLTRYSLLLPLLVMALLTMGLYKTRIGLAVRAVASDTDAAALSGVCPRRIFCIVFFISGMTAALSSFLYCSHYKAAFPLMGASLGMKAYTASVIGGIGSLPGAVLGGLSLGILETLVKCYIAPLTNGRITAAFADGAVYAVLLLMLLFRPQGFLGKEPTEKV